MNDLFDNDKYLKLNTPKKEYGASLGVQSFKYVSHVIFTTVHTRQADNNNYIKN
jgi:hypothetical protein